MRGRLAGLALGVLLLTACAGGTGEDGKASLWITRDRGEQVLLLRTVDAGQTAMQALESVAEVETRYGGRFVQSIQGIEGSVTDRRDWFWFVNGIEGDRSAAEYRLQPGDIEWWDYRSWAERMQEPVVVGAFPEPFLHGYNGERRPTAVLYPDASFARSARSIGRLIGAETVQVAPLKPPLDANVFVLGRSRDPRLFSRLLDGDAGGRVLFELHGATDLGVRLARDPTLVRRRYQWP